MFYIKSNSKPLFFISFSLLLILGFIRPHLFSLSIIILTLFFVINFRNIRYIFVSIFIFFSISITNVMYFNYDSLNQQRLSEYLELKNIINEIPLENKIKLQ